MSINKGFNYYEIQKFVFVRKFYGENTDGKWFSSTNYMFSVVTSLHSNVKITGFWLIFFNFC